MPFFRSASDCVFCKIAAGNEKTKVIRQTDNVVVFKDIHPVAEFHLLAVPKSHLADAKCLDKSHSSLVAELVDVGELTLQDLIAEAGQVNPPFFDSELRVGFHWPPFISVSHLHLHLIYPASTISGLPKYIGEFHPRAWWFRSPSWVLDRIAAIEPKKPPLSTSANHHSSPSPHQPDKKDDDNSMAIPPSLPIRDQGPLADHQTIVNGGGGGGELLPAEKDGEGGKNKIDNQEELKRPPDDPVSTNSMAVGTS